MYSKKTSYGMKLTKDKDKLINVGSKVTIFQIQGEKLEIAYELTTLKNPSYIALTLDEKVLACANTSGHIALHNFSNGELIFKTKALSRECGSLIFTSDGTQIIFTTCEGDIVSIDAQSGKIIKHLETDMFLPKIFSGDGGDLFVHNQLGTIYRFVTDTATLQLEALFSIQPYALDLTSNLLARAGSKYYLLGEKDENTYILICSLQEHKLIDILDLNQILGVETFFLNEYGIIYGACIREQEDYLVIGTSRYVIVLDLIEKKHVVTIEKKYVSNLMFFNPETLLVGSWNGIRTYSQEELCISER